jgi:hypothetical protein
MSCIPVLVQLLFPLTRYPSMVRGWKRAPCCTRCCFGGRETKSLSSLLVAIGGGAFAAFFLAANFVNILIYLMLVHIQGLCMCDYYINIVLTLFGVLVFVGSLLFGIFLTVLITGCN